MTAVLDRPAAAGTRAPTPARRLRQPLLLVTLVAVGAELIPVTPGPVLAVAGLWLLFGAPIILFYSVADAVVSTPTGRLVLAVGGAVLTDILLALAVNTVLPLHRLSLAVASALFIGVFAVIAPPRTGMPRIARAPGLTAVLSLGGIAVVLAVAGPVRLNNGRGATVAVLALLVTCALIVVLTAGRRRHAPAVTATGIFLVAVALLLLTSLRGWDIAGHDLRREYAVFLRTDLAGRWSIADFRDPYNACLSITLLPASITRLTGIPAVAVFKVIFPVLFAVAPVALYRAVRNGAPQLVAILSAVYFVAFPTFFTDMPFLARQEIAFLLLGCAVLVLTDAARPLPARRLVATALLTGVVLAHYSTTYVLLAVLLIGYALGHARRLLPGRRLTGPMVVTWWMIAAVAAAALLWTGPVTGTGGQVGRTTQATVLGLLGAQTGSGSSDTAYSLFGGDRVGAQERLDDYAAEALRDTAAERATGAYLPIETVDRYPVVAVEPAELPLTPLGTVLSNVGLDVSAVNAFLRGAAARLLQVLLLVGLILAVAARRRVFAATPDQFFLAVGGIVVVGVLTVLPVLSADYGVLRAFQQGLFFFAPFIAAASIWLFRWAGRRATLLAGALAVAFVLDLTGVVPRALGGYPPQLHLANAGPYYDIYYPQPEQRAGLAWAQRQAGAAEVQLDVHPALILQGGWVVLGHTTVHKGETTVFHGGDLVTYRYPAELLDRTRDKVYSSAGTEVYR